MRSTNDASSACFNSSLTLCWAGFASADSGRDAGLAAGPPSDPELAGTDRQYRTSIPYLQEEEPEVSRLEPVRPARREPQSGPDRPASAARSRAAGDGPRASGP